MIQKHRFDEILRQTFCHPANSPGFGSNPVKPFQVKLAKELGSSFFVPTPHIKTAADTEHNCRVRELALKFLNPKFLTRKTEG